MADVNLSQLPLIQPLFTLGWKKHDVNMYISEEIMSFFFKSYLIYDSSEVSGYLSAAGKRVICPRPSWPTGLRDINPI